MITVLLAVYNGEKYLREQIESILNQSVSDIRIVIRDDGSVDKSNGIIEEYLQKFSYKICKHTPYLSFPFFVEGLCPSRGRFTL